MLGESRTSGIHKAIAAATAATLPLPDSNSEDPAGRDQQQQQ